MSFCTNCGHKLMDGAKFCDQCGAKVANNQVEYVPVEQPKEVPSKPLIEQNEFQNNSSPVVLPYDFSAIPIRYRCINGHVFDSKVELDKCSKCGTPLTKGGLIQLYRMGNIMGVAVGMGLYIDGESYGHLANKQSIRISVPYGNHTLHVVHTATRKCNDPQYNITQSNPYVFGKAYFTSGGWAINVETVDPKEMPTK